MKGLWFVIGIAAILAGLASYCFLKPWPPTWTDQDFVDFATFLAAVLTPAIILLTVMTAAFELKNRETDRLRQDLDQAILETRKEIEAAASKSIVIQNENGEGSNLKFKLGELFHPVMLSKFPTAIPFNPQSGLNKKKKFKGT